MARHQLGLLGANIATSLSPALHQAEASALGLADYSYDLLDLHDLNRSPEQAGAVLRQAVADGYTGFSVTHPCKQLVLPALDELSPQAAALNATNTVVVTADGRLVGHNTDHSGFRSALDRVLPDVDRSRVVLFGAGGAGSAVAHALAAAGVDELVIIDVRARQAVELAVAVARTHPGMTTHGATPDEADRHVREAIGVVNASPIGMEGGGPGLPATPFDVDALTASHWVADIVYRPVRTALLAAAAERGCRTLDGAQMLVAQAADSFSLLTGRDVDRARMQRSLTALLTDAMVAR